MKFHIVLLVALESAAEIEDPWRWVQKTTKAPKKQLFLTLQSAASDPLGYIFLININGTRKNFSEYPNGGFFVVVWLLFSSSAICLDY